MKHINTYKNTNINRERIIISNKYKSLEQHDESDITHNKNMNSDEKETHIDQERINRRTHLKSKNDEFMKLIHDKYSLIIGTINIFGWQKCNDEWLHNLIHSS